MTYAVDFTLIRRYYLLWELVLTDFLIDISDLLTAGRFFSFLSPSGRTFVAAMFYR